MVYAACVRTSMIYGSDTWAMRVDQEQKLERAEVNPKRRTTTCSYDSSSDVFKINLVYKDQKGVDQELKWIIKVCFQ